MIRSLPALRLQASNGRAVVRGGEGGWQWVELVCREVAEGETTLARPNCKMPGPPNEQTLSEPAPQAKKMIF